MKNFFVLSAVILAVYSLPTDIGSETADDFGYEMDYGIEAPEPDYEVANFDDEDVEHEYPPMEISEEPVIGSEDYKTNGTRDGLARLGGLVGFGTGTRGGWGGQLVYVWDAAALRNAVTGNAARYIRVRGRIDLIRLFTASPGVALRVGNYKTITGGDRNAEIIGGGLRVSGGRQVIIQNIRIFNALNFAPGERPNGSGGITNQGAGAFSTIDSIGIDQSQHVWINHVELADDPWNANNTPDNRRRHDGLLDITRGANLISVSNCIFRNHNMVGLVGNDDRNQAQDGPALRVTYYLNWFRGTTQRNPRVRFGRVHVMNNLYTDIRSYGIGVGAGAQIFVERNAFINTRRAWGWASGVPNPIGNLAQLNNHFVNSRFDGGIPANVGWRPNQHYAYNAMRADNVEAHVRRNAGPRF